MTDTPRTAEEWARDACPYKLSDHPASSQLCAFCKRVRSIFQQAMDQAVDARQLIDLKVTMETGAISMRDRAADIVRYFIEDPDAHSLTEVSDSIEALLKEVFQLPFVMAGNTDYEYHDLRMLAEDVILLRSRAIRAGQQLPDGTVQQPRRINHLRVFVKRDGRWVISSHLIGDERIPGEPQ